MIMRFGLPGHGIRINGSMYYAVVQVFLYAARLGPAP